MTLDQRKAAFQVALYRWSQMEWQAEIAGDYPLLRRVTGIAAQSAIDLLTDMKPDQRVLLAQALTKRFHPTAADILGDSIRPEETRALERWDNSRRRAVDQRMSYVSRGVGKAQIATALRTDLGELGAPSSLGGAAEWFYLATEGEWRVRTYVDAGGRFGDVGYSHDVYLGDSGEIVRLLSVLSWLGISSSTRFKIQDESDVSAAAASVRQLTQHFLAAFPTLVRA